MVITSAGLTSDNRVLSAIQTPNPQPPGCRGRATVRLAVLDRPAKPQRVNEPIHCRPFDDVQARYHGLGPSTVRQRCVWTASGMGLVRRMGDQCHASVHAGRLLLWGFLSTGVESGHRARFGICNATVGRDGASRVQRMSTGTRQRQMTGMASLGHSYAAVISQTVISAPPHYRRYARSPNRHDAFITQHFLRTYSADRSGI